MNDDGRKRTLDEVTAGLLATPKQLSPKFFYDALGSTLFEAITVTPEYYPTGCELQILSTYGPEIAQMAGDDLAVIELGTGSAHKVIELLSALHKVRAYVPVDISPVALEEAAVHVQRAFTDLKVQPLVADFSQPLQLPLLSDVKRRLVFYPGSTIGNFDRAQAGRFLGTIASWLEPGDVLIIGADLVKDPAVIERAYNDEAGVTAAFNRNMLLHLNRAIGADFDVSKVRHEAFWNAGQARIEMHLRATEDHEVHLGPHTIQLKAGESIHTESSHKFTLEGLDEMAGASAFERAAWWTDDRGWFAVVAYRKL